MRFETFVGLRYLKSRQRTSFVSVITIISILGVTLGVATLSVVLSVMNGFQTELLTRVIDVNAHALVYPFGTDFRHYPDSMKRIRKIKGVKSVAPIVLGSVMVAVGKRIAGVGVKGIDLKASIHQKPLLGAKVGKGNLQKLLATAPGEIPGIAIGKALAQKLRVQVGDVVNLSSPISLFGLNYRTQSRYRTFRVVFVFQFGMHQYDSKFCFIALSEAQRFFNLKNNVTALELLLDDIHSVGKLKWVILKKINQRPHRIQDWRQLDQNLFKAIEQNKLMLSTFLLFITLVASLNIAGTLILIVMEKAKDIAILRTMGAQRRDIMRIFMTYGMYIGSLGTMAGIVLGVILCKIGQNLDLKLDAEVYFISKLPILIKTHELVIVAITAMLISFLATLYPAIQASRQKPVDVLRYE